MDFGFGSVMFYIILPDSYDFLQFFKRCTHILIMDSGSYKKNSDH